MRTHSIAFIIALSLIATACGSTNPAGPSSSPAPSFADDTPYRVTLRSVDASCPDGAAPQVFRVEPNDASASFYWSQALGVQDYRIEVEYFASTNVWQFERYVSVGDVDRADVRLTEGHYRARIRTRSCFNDAHFGPYSNWLEFTIGSGASEAVVFTEPVGENPTGGDDPPYPSDECTNGSDGDHNDDGHADCGKGPGEHGNR